MASPTLFHCPRLTTGVRGPLQWMNTHLVLRKRPEPARTQKHHRELDQRQNLANFHTEKTGEYLHGWPKTGA